ncbi:hypothetical protein [Bradyrhizobium sp. DASA03120]|uniref:hypothetical protein n=1 Tax=Bradyrhizobium sp. SMVTL-02 TaxID=3395917 RepID=UPI003F72A71E
MVKESNGPGAYWTKRIGHAEDVAKASCKEVLTFFRARRWRAAIIWTMDPSVQTTTASEADLKVTQRQSLQGSMAALASHVNIACKARRPAHIE